MMSAKEQPPTETDDNEEGEFFTSCNIPFYYYICFTVVTIIYPDCKVINSLGAMANAALRTCTWLDVKRCMGGLPYSLQLLITPQPTFVEFTLLSSHHAKYLSVSLQLRRHL